MHTGSVTNFFAKEAEKDLQKKITFLVGTLLLVICLAFIFVVSIPRSHLNYAIGGEKIVKAFSKTPPTIQTTKALKPEIRQLLMKKERISKNNLNRLKKLYKSLATKKTQEKSTQKKLKLVRRSINKQQIKLNRIETLLSQK